MSYGLGTVGQEGFGGGMFRGRRAPRDSVYDALNALLNDEGDLFERGATALLTSSDAATALRGLADLNTLAGQRTLAWTAAKLYRMETGTPVDMAIVNPLIPLRRLAAIGPESVFLYPLPADKNAAALAWYAGSAKPFNAGATITATVTKDSRAVTGSGTNFLTDVDPGTYVAGAGGLGIVESVESNTALTLLNPWPGTTSVGATLTAQSFRFAEIGMSLVPGGPPTERIFGATCLAASSVRLFIGARNRVYFSRPYDPSGTGWGFTQTVGAGGDGGYHELPVAANVIGVQALGDVVFAFTTAGVWGLSNTDFDPFDSQGNLQQSVQNVSRDLLLWGESGIAAWSGGIVAPCVDDVFLMSAGGAASPVSGAIRSAYREYVAAGMQPGMGVVHRAHYLLPILDGAFNVVDVLVCRLDQSSSRGGIKPAWTRLGGHAAGLAYTSRVGATTRQPKLLGVSGLRATDLTDCFDLTAAGTDADGSVPTFDVVTNDLPTGPGARGATCRKVRIRYELAGVSAAVQAAVARGSEDAAFVDLTEPGDAGPSDGTKPATWKVDARAPALRFRFRSTSANSKLLLHGFEMHLRQTGKA